MEYVIKLSRNFYSNRRKPDFLQVIVDAVFPLCYNDNVGAVGLPPCFVYLAESLALHFFKEFHKAVAMACCIDSEMPKQMIYHGDHGWILQG